MANYPDRCQHLKNRRHPVRIARPAPQPFLFLPQTLSGRTHPSLRRPRPPQRPHLHPSAPGRRKLNPIALMQVMRLLLSQQIDHKTASLMLYALQTASTNLRMTNFKPRVHYVVLHPADAANTPLQSDVWDDEDFEDEDEKDEEEAETAARAAEAESREREERENRLKGCVSRHPGLGTGKGRRKAHAQKNRAMFEDTPFMRNASRNSRRNLHHGPKRISSRPRRKISPRR
jgi:hypothetical protein